MFKQFDICYSQWLKDQVAKEEYVIL